MGDLNEPRTLLNDGRPGGSFRILHRSSSRAGSQDAGEGTDRHAEILEHAQILLR